jgi:hypothetical protein
MTSVELGIQKQVVATFEDLHAELPKISSKVSGLGWKQRNELVTHVYTHYNNHEKLNEAKTAWENLHAQKNAMKWLYDLMVEHRDLYGYFENYKELIEELDGIIQTAVEMEKFEIAEILSYWRNKLPNPLH